MPTLLLAVLLAGCGGGSSSLSASVESSTQPTTPSVGSQTATAGKTATARQTTSTSHTASVPTRSTKISTPNSTISQTSPHVGGRLLRRFSGSGNTRLGTIVLSSPTLLVWQARNPAIQIFTASGFMLVSSHSLHGSVALSRGRYNAMRVASRASWIIELRARS